MERYQDACNPLFGFAAGSDGALGVGADGNALYAPGGGGGYCGGGSGAGDAATGTGAGGGGGSSYVPGDPNALNTTCATKADGSQRAGKVTISYTVSTVPFDANGGSGSMLDQSANVPTAFSVNVFTRSGYTFAGWNTAADGSGMSYAEVAESPFTASATLYAQWTLCSGGCAGADLSGLDRRGADLRGVDLSRANLEGTLLGGAMLQRTDLRGADLRGADLTDARPRKANLAVAKLRGASLRHADLTNANLREANLVEANLTRADFTGANLTRADMRRAIVKGARLKGARTVGTKGLPR